MTPKLTSGSAKAAEQGHINAQFSIGTRYATGRGVQQDDVEAVAWFRQAAEQGHIEAKNNLGVMYAEGRGVPQDYVEAHMWLNLAASRSSGSNRERTVAARDRVAELMTSADLSAAHRARGTGASGRSHASSECELFPRRPRGAVATGRYAVAMARAAARP